MTGDDLAGLLRALVDQQQAEDTAARAAWKLAEAEEADPPRPKEVAQARARYEAAVAAAARARWREIEAQLDPAEVNRAHAMLAGGRG
jgi:ATPase subunit of ABC transporter with duplicated ATPase domains